MFPLGTNLTGEPTGRHDFLTPEECSAVVRLGESGLKIAKTEDHEVRETIRKSEIAWFNPENEATWIFNRVRDCINNVNASWFGYKLIGLEPIQFTKYAHKSREQSDFYSSHRDTVLLPGGTVRKLSFTIQLTAAETYDGGDVILYNSLTDSITLSKALGSISFFPSYTIHEVLPVDRGVRYSLVGWAYGPAFV